jgi:hypothetical protein
MKSPIETMLDGVQWMAREDQPGATDGTPYATHEGVLEILGHKLRCYRLNTGQTVFNADDVNAFFGAQLA